LITGRTSVALPLQHLACSRTPFSRSERTNYRNHCFRFCFVVSLQEWSGRLGTSTAIQSHTSQDSNGRSGYIYGWRERPVVTSGILLLVHKRGGRVSTVGRGCYIRVSGGLEARPTVYWNGLDWYYVRAPGSFVQEGPKLQ